MKPNHYESDIKEIVNNINSCATKFKNKKILLVGANGFLGKYFVKTFDYLNNIKNYNIKIDCYDNHISSKKTDYISLSKSKNIKFLTANINDIKINKKYNYIIFLAGIASPFIYKKYPVETLSVSYLGVKNLLDKSKKDNSEFIFFSSSEIYGNPDIKNIPTKETYYGNVNSFGPRSCYDEGKRVGETLCYIYKNYYSCNVKIVRPFNVFGPLMNKKDYRIIPNIVNKIKEKKNIFIHGNGKQTRTFCYITDAMCGFFRVILIGKSGEVYNIGNPYNEINMLNLVKIFDKLLNKKNNFKLIDYPKHYPADEPLRRCPDINKAKSHCKFVPKVNVKDGISKILKFNNLSAN